MHVQKILSSLFAQKTWANRELFDVVASVSATEHAAALHTAIRTLNHIYVVDRIFRAHLLNEKHGYMATNTTETPELSELHFAVTETDIWFEDYVSKLGEQELGESLLFQFTDGDSGTMTREGDAVPCALPWVLPPRQCRPSAEGHIGRTTT